MQLPVIQKFPLMGPLCRNVFYNWKGIELENYNIFAKFCLKFIDDMRQFLKSGLHQTK